ncbi:transferrin-binding protein-like solute binding protein [Yoonia sp. SDW83-1]|uniref:transferrin-binding protein-like solute binding protein n=1 Tax=Yoonia sp. SDW83-1 TaxID=3366945 RepID=UPI00398C51DE
MTRLNLFAGTAALLMLVACGSSGSDSDTPTPTNVTPQASSGFAVAGETSRGNVTFTIRNAPSYDQEGDFSQIVANGGDFEDADGEEIPFTLDSFELGSQNVSIAFNDDETEVTLTINGTDYQLERVIDPEEPEALLYSFESDSVLVGLNIAALSSFFDLGTTEEVVTIVAASEITNTTDTFVLDVFGFDTDPTLIQATTGTATYTGNAFIFGTNINDSGPDDGMDTDPNAPAEGFDGLEGTINLTADFDDSSIGGFATFTNDPLDDEPLLTETVTFEDTAITGNGFSGSLTSDEQFFEEGVTFGDVTYDGNFYGAEGENIAGAISGDLIVEGAGAPVLMLGVFGGTANATDP